jgi:hypothetical protein
MSITTYAELKTAVANWLHRDDLTSYVDDIITLGERRILREIRTRDMEASLNLTLSNGVATVPSDYVALKHARIDGSPSRPLSQMGASQVYQKFPLRSASGIPQYIAVDNGSFIFGPFPDSSYTLLGTYYKRLSALSSGTNTLFTSNPDLYLAASLSEALAFNANDKRLAVWEAKYQSIKEMLNSEDEAARGNELAVTTA